VCSFSKCGGCLLVSEDAPPGFPESWKGGHSSRGQTTHSFATDERDGELKGGVLPPPPSTTTATTMAASTSLASTPTVGLLRRRLPLLN
jgi:hypothetical protein